MGDTFFKQALSVHRQLDGGSAAGVIANADRVLKMARPTRRSSRPRPARDKADLKAFRDMLADGSGRIQKQVKGGKCSPR